MVYQGYRVLYLRHIRNIDVRIHLIPTWENPSTTKANRPVTAKLVAVTLTTQIPGLPHSTVQKQDTNRKETIKILIFSRSRITRSGTCCSRTWTRPKNFIQSGKSRRSSSPTWVTLKSSSFAKPLPRYNVPIVLYWEKCIENCTCGKCMKPTERTRQLSTERFDVLSISGYVIKKESYPWCQTSVRQQVYFKAMIMLLKPRNDKNGNCKTFWKDATKATIIERCCQIMRSVKKIFDNVTQLHWQIIPFLRQKKKSKREILENFVEQMVSKDHWNNVLF